MTSHPHRSKKSWSTVRISAKDARDLTQMLNLHVAQCEYHVRKCLDAIPLGAGLNHPERERVNKAVRSWSRAARKAKSFAGQFYDMALNAEAGDQRNPDAVQLR